MGEELTYSLSYGWIKGGEGKVRLERNGKAEIGQLRAVAEARSTGLIGWLYPVEDRYCVVFRAPEGFPEKVTRTVKKGKYTSREDWIFLEENHRVRSSRTGDHRYAVKIYDVLTAFYQARERIASEGWRLKGEVLVLPLFYDDRFFDLRVRYAGDETIRTFRGREPCALYIPVTEGNDTFTQEEQLHIWVTRDTLALPVRIIARLSFGSLRCELEEIRDIRKQPKGK